MARYGPPLFCKPAVVGRTTGRGGRRCLSPGIFLTRQRCYARGSRGRERVMPELPELPLVGDEFAGFRLRSVLGRGGMAVVFQAENPRLGSLIALKVLAPELATDDAF